MISPYGNMGGIKFYRYREGVLFFVIFTMTQNVVVYIFGNKQQEPMTIV